MDEQERADLRRWSIVAVHPARTAHHAAGRAEAQGAGIGDVARGARGLGLRRSPWPDTQPSSAPPLHRAVPKSAWRITLAQAGSAAPFPELGLSEPHQPF